TLLERDIPPGLVIVEAPMGEGKTEAAWILAEKWRHHGYQGLYMALPTMATSDSLFERYRRDYLGAMARGEGARLVHGMAWLRDDKEPEQGLRLGERGDEDRELAEAWFRPTRRAMLAAHGIGTVDQVLLAGMNVKFGFLRLYGLTGRVLVIDEVHAYDAYMSAILARLLRWCACLDIPVILLSATLSAAQRAAMIEAYGGASGDPGPDAPYPLITIAEAGKSAQMMLVEATGRRNLVIRRHSGLLGDAERTAALALALVKEGACCCVILNTVKQAQAVYQALALPDDQKMLFHARFTAADRERIAAKVVELFGKVRSKRPGRFILVATQVVEQSLDVDFDHMVSEIAPMDLLLQRSGRLYRHRPRPDSPVLNVLMPEGEDGRFGATGYIYQAKPLLRTLAILRDTDKVSLPGDFRVLIERCYGGETWDQSGVDWSSVKAADQDWDKEAQLLASRAHEVSLQEPSLRRFRPVDNAPTGDDSDDGNGWRAKTRLGANDRSALLLEAEEISRVESGRLSQSEVRNLYRKSLKLPYYLPYDTPVAGFAPAVQGKGKCRGLTLLPMANGVWKGRDSKGKLYQVSYDETLGLLVRSTE
ncbi:MAG: CRISPR-associated helicase Cas3', partial [bacterium]